jgi:Domain of unknown function (DUF4340)
LSWKKVWVYLAVLVVVAGVFIVSEFFIPRQAKEGDQPPIFNLSPGAIQEIRWQRGESVIELKKNKIWEMVKPLSTPADPVVVDGVLQVLSSLKAERKFQPAGKDLNEFGLNPPLVRIDFTAQGKKFELQLGSKSVAGQTRYVKTALHPDIYLAEAFTIKELDRDVLALREKKVFSLTPDQIESLIIGVGKKNLQLVKSAQGWVEKGQPEKRLAKNRVESLILDLTWVKAKEFLEGEKENSAWGLKEPAYRIRLSGGGKEKKDEGLWIGAEAGGKGFYARSSLYPSALIVEGEILKKIPADLTEWEEKPVPEKGSGGPESKKGS